MIGSYVDASAKYEDPSNVLMFTTVFLVPILEETVFRGLVGDRMGRFLPKWLAIPMASLAFAVMHGNLLWCTYAFVSGMVLTWMYFRCKSILPCISFHLAFNASNYLWAIFLPLPDESWAHILSLSLGGVICLSAEIAVIIRLKMENHK
jgi:membrane protease YdiL (CAAX protease family)